MTLSFSLLAPFFLPRRLRSVVLTVVSAVMLAAPLSAPAQNLPIAPALAARNWMLVDLTTGQLLAAHEPNARVDPASLTKLMTDYLTLAAVRDKKLSLTQSVPVPVNLYKRVDQRAESVMFIPPGKTATVDDLLHGLIIQSGNDAAIVLAEAVAGSETTFVDMMNREAKRMGMASTSYRNPTGMSNPEHYTTAADLAILVKNLIADFPEYYKLYSQKEFTYNGIKQANRNRLLWLDPTVDGVKTGHTEAAGYCLISSARRAQADGSERRLLSIVLGATSSAARAEESLKLLNWGFQNFDAVKLYDKGQALATPQVWKGTLGQVKLGFDRPVYLTVPKGRKPDIKPVLDRKDPLVAPINAGDRLGTLKVTVDGKVIAEMPVLALESVPLAGIIGRAWDSLRLMFN
jgi:D-alanyl-D-alanine carboxypeptidase (penicillin-binding protein 5/6)